MLNATGPEGAQDGSELEDLAEAAALPEPGAKADLKSLALAAGLSPETVKRARRPGQFGAKAEATFRAARVRALSVGLAPKAMQTLSELMEPGIAPAVRLQAAKWVLEVAGHRPAAQQADGAKPLEDMSSDELAAMIGRLDDTLDGRARAARKVIPPGSADLPAEGGA